MNYNNTQPLPYASNIDNRIYEYNPFLDDECLESAPLHTSSPKRAKSVSSRKVSSQSLSASLNIKKPVGRSASYKYPKRKLRVSPPASGPSSGPATPTFYESEFSFCSGYGSNTTTSDAATDSSDLESLPDLTEDDGTPTTTPTKTQPPLRSCFFQDPVAPQKLHFNPPSALLPPPCPAPASPSIFDVPELVYKIVEYAALQNTVIPQENSPVRRKPLSYNHALLIHGNKESAQLALKATTAPGTRRSSHGVLYNCLQVNKLFHQVTMEVLSKNLYFSDEIQFNKMAASLAARTTRPKLRPTSFVLHKLFMLKQNAIDAVKQHIDFRDLEWLELYMCPKLYPTAEFFEQAGRRLKKLIVTGSKVVDDEFLVMVSQHCPNLEVLDIRACESVSDTGVYHVAQRCRNLTNINFGRKQRGHLITDNSISVLITNNKRLVTVGLAGCHISDRSVWDLAIHCSGSLQRLSLNNCPYVTDQSIPLILTRPNTSYPTSYFQNLSVLELRFDLHITHWQPIIEFKRRQEYRGVSMLIEVCETLMVRMRQQELEMDRAISQRIFKDILEWVNDANDGDLSYHQLLESRRAAVRNV